MNNLNKFLFNLIWIVFFRFTVENVVEYLFVDGAVGMNKLLGGETRYYRLDYQRKKEIKRFISTMIAIPFMILRPVVYTFVQFLLFGFINVAEMSELVLIIILIQVSHLIFTSENIQQDLFKNRTTLYLDFFYFVFNLDNENMFVPCVFYILDLCFDFGEFVKHFQSMLKSLFEEDHVLSSFIINLIIFHKKNLSKVMFLRIILLTTMVLYSFVVDKFTDTIELLFYFFAVFRLTNIVQEYKDLANIN